MAPNPPAAGQGPAPRESDAPISMSQEPETSTAAPATPADKAAFLSFFERNERRERQRRGRRRVWVASITIHLVALSALAFLSLWQVEELWTPTVKVTVFSRSAARTSLAPSKRGGSPT